MSAVRNLKDVLREFPEFNPGWVVSIGGVPQLKDTFVEMSHPKFGRISQDVVMTPDGKPAFDRPGVIEGPPDRTSGPAFAQVVVWGYDGSGRVLIAMVNQKRPHSDHYDHPNQPCEPITYEHVMMGFSDADARKKMETVAKTIVREARSEVIGDDPDVVIKVETAKYGHNPSPSYIRTVGEIGFMQVDLNKLRKPDADPDEPIEGVYWRTVPQLLQAVRDGISQSGGFMGCGTSYSALFAFFAHYPQFFEW